MSKQQTVKTYAPTDFAEVLARKLSGLVPVMSPEGKLLHRAIIWATKEYTKLETHIAELEAQIDATEGKV